MSSTDSTKLGSGEDTDKVDTSSPMADTSGVPLSNSNLATTPSPPPRVSELEAMLYYRGLPSNPRLIARTGEPWYPPSGPEAYPRANELRSLGKHKLFDIWEDNLALKVHNILDENQVNWSSTEIVRIAYVDEPDGNIVLWIGVYSTPTRLSYDVGIDCRPAAEDCCHRHTKRARGKRLSAWTHPEHPWSVEPTMAGLHGWTMLTLCLLVVPLPPPPFSALGGFIPAQSSRSVEPSSKRIWLTSLTNGLIFKGSVVCLFPV